MATPQIKKAERPAFLTVLCILTFIWSGLNIVSNFFTMILFSFTGSLDASFLEYLKESVHDEFAGQIMQGCFEIIQRLIQFGFVISLTSLILYGASLAGAILMFNLKRMGFYLYTLAQILLLFVAPVFLGWNFFVGIGILFSSFFAILFIALYGLNFKHLR